MEDQSSEQEPIIYTVICLAMIPASYVVAGFADIAFPKQYYVLILCVWGLICVSYVAFLTIRRMRVRKRKARKESDKEPRAARRENDSR